MYASAKLPPRTIPPSPQSATPTKSMWLNESYFQSPHSAPPGGTVAHFEEWQEDLKVVLVHKPSGTLCGGETGVVHVVRSLAYLLLNFSAVRGDFTPPEDPPTNYDLTRLPINEWPRLLQWIDSWTLAINVSTAILRKTSQERRKGLDGLGWLIEEILQEPTEVNTHRSSTDPTPPHEPIKSKIKSRRDRKGKRRASSISEDEGLATDGESQSDNDEEEVDFEHLDRTSEDESSDDDLHESCYGGQGSAGYLSRGNTAGDGDVSVEPDRLDAQAGLGTSGESPV